MKLKQLRLSDLRLNDRNPRTMTKEKHDALVKSVLLFPTMLSIREIVVDNDNIVIAGNMRYRALSAIYDLSEDEIKQVIKTSRKWQARTQVERDALLRYWLEWIEEPIISVKDGSELDEYERNEFIIKDNESFGEWDWDLLASDYDEKDLLEWGMDVWDPEEDNDDKNGTGDGLKNMTFKFTEETFERVTEALKVFDEVPETALMLALGLKEV